MVTEVVAVYRAQPPAAAIVYVTVYVFAELLAGVIVPVELLILNPVGDAVKVPPEVPFRFTVTGELERQKGDPV